MNTNAPEEIIRLVLDLKSQLYTKGSIVRAVNKKVKNKDLARQYVEEILHERKTVLSGRTMDEKVSEAKNGLLYSALICAGSFILGGIITGITYSMAEPGGTYTVTTGLFLVGLISGVIALWRLFQLLFYLASRGSNNKVAASRHHQIDSNRTWKDLN